MEKIIAFICPLSEPGSDVRQRSDSIMDYILVPIASELGYTVDRADLKSGSKIMADIIDMLYKASIVVADLSDLNVNVFYELGLFNAIKGKCINMAEKGNLKNYPFDVNAFRFLNYDIKSPGGIEEFKREIRKRILSMEEQDWHPVFDLKPVDVSDFFGTTVVLNSFTGKKEHYSMAKKLFHDRKCKRVFLMQRSSSLILGAEQGWGEEAEFLKIMRDIIGECENFYHIVTLEGIEAHFQRKDSVFPKFKDFSSTLLNIEGQVAIKKCQDEDSDGQPFFLRKLPQDGSDAFFKLDRQARVLVVEFEDNTIEAIIVQNLGPEQFSFHLRGNKLKDYLNSCIAYYEKCDLVDWEELEDLYARYKVTKKVKTPAR